MMRFANILKLAMLAVVGAALSHTSASAAASPYMLMCIDDGSPTATCGQAGSGDFIMVVSNGATIDGVSTGGTVGGAPANGTACSVSIPCSLTDISLGVSVGLSITTNDTGSQSIGSSPMIDLLYGATFTGAGTVNIFFTAADYPNPPAVGGYSVGGTNSTHTSTSVSGCYAPTAGINPSVSLDLSAGLQPCANYTPEIVTYSSGASAYSSTGGSGGTTPGDAYFNLEEDVTITNTTGHSQATGDFSLIPAPEPTSILMLGGALVLACGAIRRKLHNN